MGERYSMLVKSKVSKSLLRSSIGVEDVILSKVRNELREEALKFGGRGYSVLVRSEIQL